MRKVALLLGGMLIGCALLGVAQETMDLDTALGFFQNDQIMIEYSEAGRAQLEEIIDALKAGLGVPEDLDEDSEDAVGAFEVDMALKNVVVSLSQAYYTLANVFMTEPENYPFYRAGKHWAFNALRMSPDFNDNEGGRFDESVAQETDVPAMYWLNANWLRSSKENKIQAVFAGVPAKSEMLSQRILELDPNYIAGGIYRSLGGYYEQLPSMMGRDMGQALFYLCHVVDEPSYCSECGAGEMVPGAYEYFENRTFFVEFYLMPEKHWEDAARILESVLDEEVGDVYPLMNAYSQAHAQTLLDEVNEHL